MIMKEYLMTCKNALESKLLRLLSERQHFVENSHLYCIQVFQLELNLLNTLLKKLIGIYRILLMWRVEN